MSYTKPLVRKRKSPPELQLNIKKISNDTIDTIDCSDSSDDTESLICHEDIDIFKTPSLPPSCHCVHCFVYLGETNPRQYCRKIRCDYDFLDEDEILQIQICNISLSPYYNDPTFDEYLIYHDKIQKFIDVNT